MRQRKQRTLLHEGLANLRDATTAGQRVASFTQLAYGLAALLCLVALRTRSSWTRPVLGLWGLSVVLTAGLAPVVWGGADWVTGLLSGLVTLVIVALVGWGYLAHLRTSRAAPVPDAEAASR